MFGNELSIASNSGIDIQRSLICIEDNANNTGAFLVKDFILSKEKNHCDVHILCYEKHHSKQIYGSSSHIYYHDGLSDILAEAVEDLDDPSFIRMSQHEISFFKNVKQFSTTNGPLVIVIDSLSALLFHQEFSSVYQEIHKLMTWKMLSATIIEIVAVIHTDILEEEHKHTIIEHFKFLADVWVSIDPENYLTISKKRKSGNLNIKRYKYSLDDNKKVVDKKYIEMQPVKKEDIQVPLSTFKLLLTDEEKIAREKVKLPYTRDDGESDEESLDSEINSSQGDIFYVPDKFDDWDDEDPDNDLNY